MKKTFPCEIGATVWVTSDTRAEEATVLSFNIDKHETTCLLSFLCTYNCEGCPFADWAETSRDEYECQNEWGTLIVPISEFDHSVFLSRKEAIEKGGILCQQEY